jgi:hypothetical protein
MFGLKLFSSYERQGLTRISHRVCIIALRLIPPSLTDIYLRTEDYDAELDKMTNAIAAENQALQYDNKQLNLLIKEYEQTLETLMTTFRKRAVSSSF